MKAPFHRHTGLIILEVVQSNPNGDPDLESDPRMMEADGRGIISPVSFKRKIRDMVLEDGLVMHEAKKELQLEDNKSGHDFQILESRGRKRDEIFELNQTDFTSRFWDARVFGNTFLESIKENEGPTDRDLSHFISTGVIQVGVGLSIAPITIDRMTNTNKSGVQEGKDRGMAPLAFRVVRHGIYAIPYFVNPSMAKRNHTTQKDIELFEFLAPHAYAQTASAIRSDVRCLHIWRGVHKSALGSCPDHVFLEHFTPKVKEGVQEPAKREDYEIPTIPANEKGQEADLEKLKCRFESIDDLTRTV